ncbi:tetratricopeptide (TPR) repeat protein [Rhodopirellula rubra]|uniref:Tetratricopeptide (TPR) repeat protein n=1 Tax=Aporhodopirellula rubra TaxID=980271 RepID=A0A7W5E4Q9_9BACT|nr:hypothetical protein [Aporhodopirellula rubra]MBB3210063.1 tetratricopeptide (TPR) repeat protein [Aporhodopirellula rubra]
MRSTVFTCCAIALAFSSAIGCRDDSSEMERIMAQRQVALQEKTRQDHLGETVSLLDQYVVLNEQKARRQIAYHANQWIRENAARLKNSADNNDDATIPKIAQSLGEMIAPDAMEDKILRPEFTTDDVPFLRDANTFRRVVAWIDSPVRDDLLFADWLAGLRKSSAENADSDGVLTPMQIDRLQTAMRLFDWTVRNIALEPETLQPPTGLQIPPMPPGIPFEGPGFRQSDYQTLWRGRGDWLQRCGVFTQLCMQAGIPAAVLATQSDETGRRTPWCVGVLVGEQIYLFEPRLGLPIPGPNQTGVATLAQARKDASVMRRLDVAGYFDYPLSRSDISQSVALLNVHAETLAPRMKLLESGLTGDRRMTLWVDANDWAEKFDAVPGIAGARIWEIPTINEIYARGMELVAERDPAFAFWYRARFAVMESNDSSANNLAKGRWKHLTGQFVDDEIEGESGARTRYLEQRAPEFEIDDLRINVELQKQYGLRRELGVEPAQYDAQLRQMQDFMRLGKRTATYWLALVQYDDGRFETAHNWFTKRVLDQDQRSYWEGGAVYNAARSSEAAGDIESAISTLKTDRNVADHGNRLRARLLDKTLPTDKSDSSDSSDSESTDSEETTDADAE